MMNTRLTRLRPVELGLLVVLGLAGPSSALLADPDHDSHARSEDHLNYVYFHDGDNTSMSGDMSDIDKARRFRRGNESMMWFRDGGQEYVIRDPATLKQIEVAWKPVNELGEAQGKLGEQQGELGKQQGELGSQQGVIGTRQGALAVREATLSMRESNDALSDADRAELAKQRRELRQQMKALTKQMKALSKPMKELSERMQVLGREMEVLGQKMNGAVQKASVEMRALFKRSIASGIARPAR